MPELFMKATSDLFIKYLFGTEEDTDLLISFINAVFEDSGFGWISSVEIKNPFNFKKYRVDKETVLDIKATDESGRIFNIEMQTQGDSHFRNRSLYYWARVYSSQLKEAEVWTLLKPVICINILDFILFPEFDSFHSFFTLGEKNHPEYLFDGHLYIHFLEIPKLTKQKKYSKLQMWLSFLKNEGTEEKDLMDIVNNDPEISKAHKRYTRFTDDEMMRDLYEARLKWKRDHNTMREIDIKKAREKGLAEGKAEGKTEAIKKIVANLIIENFSVNEISRITGLENGEIEKLIEAE